MGGKKKQLLHLFSPCPTNSHTDLLAYIDFSNMFSLLSVTNAFIFALKELRETLSFWSTFLWYKRDLSFRRFHLSGSSAVKVRFRAGAGKTNYRMSATGWMGLEGLLTWIWRQIHLALPPSPALLLLDIQVNGVSKLGQASWSRASVWMLRLLQG